MWQHLKIQLQCLYLSKYTWLHSITCHTNRVRKHMHVCVWADFTSTCSGAPLCDSYNQIIHRGSKSANKMKENQHGRWEESRQSSSDTRERKHALTEQNRFSVSGPGPVRRVPPNQHPTLWFRVGHRQQENNKWLTTKSQLPDAPCALYAAAPLHTHAHTSTSEPHTHMW